MTNKDLISQYVDTGLQLPDYQVNKLSNQDKRTYIRKRLITSKSEPLHYYEYILLPTDYKDKYINDVNNQGVEVLLDSANAAGMHGEAVGPVIDDLISNDSIIARIKEGNALVLRYILAFTNVGYGSVAKISKLFISGNIITGKNINAIINDFSSSTKEIKRILLHKILSNDKILGKIDIYSLEKLFKMYGDKSYVLKKLLSSNNFMDNLDAYRSRVVLDYLADKDTFIEQLISSDRFINTLNQQGIHILLSYSSAREALIDKLLSKDIFINLLRNNPSC